MSNTNNKTTRVSSLTTTYNGKNVRFVNVDPPKRKYTKKPVKTIVKKVSASKKATKKATKKYGTYKDTDTDTDTETDDTYSSERTDQTYTTYDTNSTRDTLSTRRNDSLNQNILKIKTLKKIKDFNDDTNDALLISSDLPTNLLVDDYECTNKTKKNKGKTNKTIKVEKISKNASTNANANANDNANANANANANTIVNTNAKKTDLTRLTDATKKPPNPAAIYASREEFEEKLKYYRRVESDKIIDLPLGTRVKYVEVLNNGTFKCKQGGVIIVNKAPTYLVLAQNRNSWSVQLSSHIIFVERFEEVRKNYEAHIKKLTTDIDAMTEMNKVLKAKNCVYEKADNEKTKKKNK